MYAKRIIPCLDVKNGRVVKGMSFVNLVDAGDPVECAKQYDKEGADELVFLDITASSDSRNITIDMVEKVANSIFIPFTVGGGIRSVDDFNLLLRAGADKVSVNSAAVHRPELISEAAYKFGSQCVVAAIDAKRKENGWEVYVNGGRTPVGLDAVEWAVKCEQLGAGEILLTSMDEDGQKKRGLHLDNLHIRLFSRRISRLVIFRLLGLNLNLFRCRISQTGSSYGRRSQIFSNINRTF